MAAESSSKLKLAKIKKYTNTRKNTFNWVTLQSFSISGVISAEKMQVEHWEIYRRCMAGVWWNVCKFLNFQLTFRKLCIKSIFLIIVVNWANEWLNLIFCGWMSFSGNKFNFNKYNRGTIDSLGTKYDYGSVMHYGSRAFSKNGRPTIVAKQSGVGCYRYTVNRSLAKRRLNDADCHCQLKTRRSRSKIRHKQQW